MPPAARTMDKVTHPLPGQLMPGPGSFNVLIGNMPAWRGLPAAQAAALQAAQAVADAALQVAQAATMAAMGTPAAPAAKAAEIAARTAAASALGAMMQGLAASCAAGGGMPDTHVCATLVPPPVPHGPGMVIDGSPTVLTNGLPQCAVGDKVLEAIGGPDPILMGCFTVMVGKSGGGGAGGGGIMDALKAAIASMIAKALSIVDKALDTIAKFVALVNNIVKVVIDGLANAVARFGKALVESVVKALADFASKVAEAAKGAAAPKRPIDDPNVQKGMREAWNDSQAGDPAKRHEEGGYIVRNPDGSLGVERWPRGAGASIAPPARDAQGKYNGKEVLGEFHTHPNPPVDENGKKWEQGGHPGDWDGIKAEKYPGESYIISDGHIYTVDKDGKPNKDASGKEVPLGKREDLIGK